MKLRRTLDHALFTIAVVLATEPSVVLILIGLDNKQPWAIVTGIFGIGVIVALGALCVVRANTIDAFKTLSAQQRKTIENQGQIIAAQSTGIDLLRQQATLRDQQDN